MWCQQKFLDFGEQVGLNPTRRGRIESAVSRFRSFCEEDKELKAALADPPFLQGSVPTNTAIRPMFRDEFDVDVIYPFKLSAFPGQGPAAIFDWFVSRIQQDEFYRKNLKRKNRCVRIDYAGDFHVDIIPSTRGVNLHQPWGVPARDLSDWITNDPIGYINWVKQIDAKTSLIDSNGDRAFVRSVRIMKRWRDQFFGDESAVSSILLTTILGKHDASHRNYTPPLEDPLFPQYSQDAAYLYDLLRLTHGCLSDPFHSAFRHPTIIDEDLARGWDDKFLDLFLIRLKTCIGHLRNGIYAKDESESVAHYKKAFGDTFPG